MYDSKHRPEVMQKYDFVCLSHERNVCSVVLIVTLHGVVQLAKKLSLLLTVS